MIGSKLDAIAMARATGDIPQNVNFAVSAGAARAFPDSEGVAYETAPSDDIAAAARAFAVLVECRNRRRGRGGRLREQCPAVLIMGSGARNRHGRHRRG